MNRYACICVVLGISFGMSATEAKETSTELGRVANSAVQKADGTGKDAESDDDGREPDTLGSITTEFNCELGNRITIYENAGDPDHIALRWKRRLHRLSRVGTNTGANRFENRTFGLVWIGIPAKSMLLDSKKNRQLANECRNTQQMTPSQPVAHPLELWGG